MKTEGKNKVTFPLAGKPLIVYGLELLEPYVDTIVVVVGAYADSVKEVLSPYDNISYIEQKEQQGTGHAVQVGLKAFERKEPSLVLVGYGDHMMFYQPQSVGRLIQKHIHEQAVASLFTALCPNPNDYGFGRIIRTRGAITGTVEQRDANEEQKNIKEFNTGFFCFDYPFLKETLPYITPSPTTGEYYLTELINMAANEGKHITSIEVAFDEVGIGANRKEDLHAGEELIQRRNKKEM